MNRESLSNADWLRTIDRLGGAELLEEAREFGAFQKARKIKRAVDQLPARTTGLSMCGRGRGRRGCGQGPTRSGWSTPRQLQRPGRAARETGGRWPIHSVFDLRENALPPLNWG